MYGEGLTCAVAWRSPIMVASIFDAGYATAKKVRQAFSAPGELSDPASLTKPHGLQHAHHQPSAYTSEAGALPACGRLGGAMDASCSSSEHNRQS